MKFAPMLVLLAVLAAGPGLAADPPDPVATVDAFDKAIARGDEAKARSLLAPDLLVYEGGGEEGSLAEYAAAHLQADMAFLARVKRKVLSRQHGESGDLAWVATRRKLVGTFKDKPVDLLATETMVLVRDASGWRIRHIQWSSQAAPPPKP